FVYRRGHGSRYGKRECSTFRQAVGAAYGMSEFLLELSRDRQRHRGSTSIYFGYTFKVISLHFSAVHHGDEGGNCPDNEGSPVFLRRFRQNDRMKALAQYDGRAAGKRQNNVGHQPGNVE